MTLIEKISWHLYQKKLSCVKFLYSSLLRKVKVNGVWLPLKLWYSNRMFQFILSGEYEKPEMNVIKKYLDPGDKVLEFGTGLGLLSAYCASIAGNANVYTFEGNEKLESVIRQTYLLNHVEPFLSFGLIGNEEKEVSFHVEPKDIWASSVTKNSATSEVITKKQLAANKLIDKYQPSFLIIDIEGAEQDILPTLALSEISKLQIEFHPAVYGDVVMKDLIAIIFKKGFTLLENADPQTLYFCKK